MIYKLCYVENNEAWFTSNWNKQWGDDWGDRPYEHNAGTPYNRYYNEEHKQVNISLKHIFFEIPLYTTLPCDGHLNSPYSVEDINNHRCPWLIIDNDGKSHYIFAGTSYKSFVKQIEDLGGTIYVPKRKGV